ncbi:MAG: hypothetical protein ABSA52_13200 [Candidatus Binatia bacterium]|jgi:hypothetical protein
MEEAVAIEPATYSEIEGVAILPKLPPRAGLGHLTGASPVRSSVQTELIGGVAATAALLIARAIS